MRKRHRALALAAPLLFACAAPPPEPCPSAQVLMDRFLAHEASFEKLLKDPATRICCRSSASAACNSPAAG